MRSLSSCHSLASICVFCSSQISDKGFLELSNLNLLALSVQNAAITGKTLARSINRWDSMWSLSLDETHIDDRYIEDLFRLPKLTLFSASMTNLDFRQPASFSTQAGCRSIAGLVHRFMDLMRQLIEAGLQIIGFVLAHSRLDETRCISRTLSHFGLFRIRQNQEFGPASSAIGLRT